MKIKIYPPLSIYELGQRANQEDALYPLHGQATDADRLFVLCDGMGGHERGEVASQTVCLSLGHWFQEHANSDTPFTDDMLREAIEYAFQELDKRDDGGIKKMGTTLTLLYLHRHGITAAHIGDSRIYHIRPNSSPSGKLGGILLYQSRDHSLVFDLYQAGEISYEEMATFPQKNIITRAMQPGEDNRVRPDIVHITDILPGDYFFLCSDGMLEQMSNEQLTSLLSEKISDEDKRQVFINATASNQDNHSAWLIHIKELLIEKGDKDWPNEEATTRYNALNIHPMPIVAADEDVSIVTESPIEQIAKRPVTNAENPLMLPIGKSGKKVIYSLALFLLFVAFVASFSFFKSGKPRTTEESTLRNPIQRVVPISKPVKHQRKALITTEATNTNKMSKDSNRIRNGKQQ